VPACIAIIIGLLLTLVPTLVSAEPIPVKYAEGVTHGFLVLRGEQGPVLAHGELMQAPHADGVQSRMTFRFTDGSLYDETVTFSQKRVFRLLAYKLVQRGPSFPEAADVTFDRAGGRYHAKVGTDDSEGTLDVPDDLHNGMTGTLLRNLPPGGSASGRGPLPRRRPRPDRGPLSRLDGPGRPHRRGGHGARQGAGRHPLLDHDERRTILREIRGVDVPQGAALADRAGSSTLARRAVAVSRPARDAASR
jgi:hypothetical protein